MRRRQSRHTMEIKANIYIRKKRENLEYRQRENRMRSAGFDSHTDMEQR